MKRTEQLARFLRSLVIAFLLAVCIVMGIAPVLPKRREESVYEVLIEEDEEAPDDLEKPGEARY